jgi:multiple antibiotic resistance protein
MNINIIEITSAFVVLFAIIDILGSVPIILGIKQKNNQINPLMVTTVSFIVMLGFLFAGDIVLKLFGVDIKSFAVAGSIIIFIMAFEMTLGVEIFKMDGPANVASIVPLAFPLIAGPGSFTSLLSLRAEYQTINIIIALMLNMIFVYVVLRMTDKIERWIGKGGIYILRKFFGIILLAIAVKLFATNIASIFGVLMHK